MRFMYAVAISIVLSAAASASAQESPLDERARLHFASGASYFDAGNYERALEEFQTAFDLSQRADLLYNIYLSHERLGNLAEAIANLERYLAGVEMDAERRAVLEQRLANLRARAAASETEPPTPQETGADPPTETDTSAADTTETRTSPAPAPAPAPSPADDSGSDLSTAALFAFIAAGTGLVLAGVFGTMALVEYNGLDDDCGPACSDDQVSSLRTFNLIADISLGVAILGTILGTVLQATGGDDDEPIPTAWLAPDGAGLAIGGTL
jgi:tetratricopeptide (TPR) repeat protein